jgi:hypothetical protein
MTETIRNDYQLSSEGAVRHWPIPYDRLEDITPTETMPAAVQSRIDGNQLTGTILSVDAGSEIAIVDVTASMAYWHTVRNVLTYVAAAEATIGAINIGDPVFYDRSPTMPAGTYLSTSPQDNLGNANPLFGYVVPGTDDSIWDTDEADYPKGGATASTQTCGVMQVGAGAAG